MPFSGLKIGFAITGSFCTIDSVLSEIGKLVDKGGDIIPIISSVVDSCDTKFGLSNELKKRLHTLTGKNSISTIIEAEPIGPKSLLDILVVAPCTGNTLGKIANGITDTSVTMACKAHLRNQKPLILAISTNDGLSGSAKNLGILLNTKNIYFVPFRQDSPYGKPCSLVADMELIVPTILESIKGTQIQPLFV